jgi:hypothetical protein
LPHLFEVIRAGRIPDPNEARAGGLDAGEGLDDEPNVFMKMISPMLMTEFSRSICRLTKRPVSTPR